MNDFEEVEAARVARAKVLRAHYDALVAADNAFRLLGEPTIAAGEQLTELAPPIVEAEPEPVQPEPEPEVMAEPEPKPEVAAPAPPEEAVVAAEADTKVSKRTSKATVNPE